MAVQLSLEDNDIAPTTGTGSGVLALRTRPCLSAPVDRQCCFYGDPTKGDGWALIDAGLPTSRGSIIDAAEHRFGRNTRPSAIILTHGHFDHPGRSKHWRAIGMYQSMPILWSFPTLTDKRPIHRQILRSAVG